MVVNNFKEFRFDYKCDEVFVRVKHLGTVSCGPTHLYYLPNMLIFYEKARKHCERLHCCHFDLM